MSVSIIFFHDFQTIVNKCKRYNVNFSDGCDTSLSYDLQQFQILFEDV